MKGPQEQPRAGRKNSLSYTMRRRNWLRNHTVCSGRRLYQERNSQKNAQDSALSNPSLLF